MIFDVSAANNPLRAPKNSFPVDTSLALSSAKPVQVNQPHHDLHLDALKGFSRERGSKLPAERQHYLIEQTLPAINDLLNHGLNSNNLQILRSNLPLLKSHLKFTLDKLDQNLQNDPDNFQETDISELAHYGASLQMAIKTLGGSETKLDALLEKRDLIDRRLKPELAAVRKFLEKMSDQEKIEDLPLPR